MKKTLVIVFSLVALMFGVAACVVNLNPDVQPVVGETDVLSLSVRCSESLTKATRPGETARNENKVTHVDWFIFPSTASSEKAVMHGRVLTPGMDNVTAAFLVKKLGMGSYISNFGTGGYVYIIANLPSEYSHSAEDIVADSDYQGGILYTKDGNTVTVQTLGDLQGLALSTDFNLYQLSDPDDFTSATFVAQTSFVMTSDLKPFDLTAATPVTVTADMSRVAAKITLNIDVASAIDATEVAMLGRDTLNVEYTKTWYPEVNDIQVYLSYGNKVTTLVGSPEKAYNDKDFFTCNRYAFVPSVNSADVTSDTFVYGTSHLTYHHVTGTPFYSYPMKWVTSDSHAPFIKIILPWTPYDETAQHKDHNYVTHNVENTTHRGDTLDRVTRLKPADRLDPEGTQDFYYKITIPTDSLKLYRNTWYQITLDVAVLGSRSDDLSTELTGTYYVVNWSPEVPSAGELTQGKYLSVAQDTYYIYGGDFIEIPVLSSHDITTTVTGVSFKDYSSTTPTTKTRLTDLTRQPSTQDYGRERFTFTHELMTDIAAATTNNKPDVSEYTFTVTITQTGVTNPLSKTITIKQQPPLMIENDKNSGGSGSYGYTYVNGGRNNYGGLSQSYLSGNSTSDNANPNMYIISTAVSPNNTALIADPRSTTISYLGANNYNWTSNGYRIGGTGQNNKMVAYYPTDESDLGKNKIAPKFRVASSYGITGALSSFQMAQRRCATYQEDGIPAGRWRVPTKSEIEFMIKLSNIKAIPSLFTPETNGQYNRGGYYSADGGVVFPWTDGTVGYRTAAEMSSASYSNYVRCVYDEWYWGTDDRLAANNRARFTWGDRVIVWDSGN